ncbi:MAG: Asp/Glu racemase [Sphingomonadales bacterium]|nr:Asp/Glu racemase [Sphingomonadales bacterium]
METEIPRMFHAREAILPERFTFHSARMRMKQVSKEELAAMDTQSVGCAEQLADAEVDVIGYACLVAIMSAGHGYHGRSEATLGAAVAAAGHSCPIVTSAGALVQVLREMNCRRISAVTPYMRPLTDLVVGYIEHEGIAVQDSIALEIPDNLEVGRRDPMALIEDVARLDRDGIDAIVLSACVQMPSLAAIMAVEDKFGLPVVSAATCTARVMLRSLGLDPVAPDAGFALSSDFRALG